MDEGEVVEWNAQSPLTRINGANQRDLGWTVPYVGDYIPVFDWFLYECAKRHAWAWFWNKYADLDHFRAHGHRFEGLNAVDGMWLWHHIQTDVMRGLGFVAPMASDFGAWKHWGKVKEKEGLYGAADGVQNWRTCMWVLQGAVDLGQWDMFVRDWHERDMYCLRPAHELGVPVDRPALEQFHADLQGKLGHILDRLKQTAADGVLKPKLGYAKRPKGPLCAACGGAGVPPGVCGYCGGPANVGVCQNYGCEGHRDIEFVCAACEGTGHEAPTPPASIIGKSKSKKAGPSGIGGEAKLQYMTEGVRLVEKIVVAEVRECRTCGKQNVGTKHRCPLPRRRRKAEGDGSVASPAPVERIAQLVLVPREQVRYFWQLPFNPDAPAQILAYLDKQGIDAPLDKKTQRKTTNKKALEGLKAQHKDDPFFSLQMDWKAVQKVDATYAVGTLKLLDADDRVHPEYLPVPATLRDSARHPNLTNVVADKSGVQGLAAGFRRCIVARDGLPRGVTAEEYAAWEARWT
jgi:hypothetical protein